MFGLRSLRLPVDWRRERFAGYLLGRVLTLRQTGNRLEQYAKRIIDEGQKSTVESRTVLAAMNASPYPKCSDAEINYFSKLIFDSQYLKAAGRMHDGRIECSTSLGRAAQSNVQYKPDIFQRDGTRMYRNIAPFRVGNETVITVQLSDSYIVYSPYNMKPLLNNSMQVTVTDVDAPSREAGRITRFCSEDGRAISGKGRPVPRWRPSLWHPVALRMAWCAWLLTSPFPRRC